MNVWQSTEAAAVILQNISLAATVLGMFLVSLCLRLSEECLAYSHGGSKRVSKPAIDGEPDSSSELPRGDDAIEYIKEQLLSIPHASEYTAIILS